MGRDDPHVPGVARGRQAGHRINREARRRPGDPADLRFRDRTAEAVLTAGGERQRVTQPGGLGVRGGDRERSECEAHHDADRRVRGATARAAPRVNCGRPFGYRSDSCRVCRRARDLGDAGRQALPHQARRHDDRVARVPHYRPQGDLGVDGPQRVERRRDRHPPRRLHHVNSDALGGGIERAVDLGRAVSARGDDAAGDRRNQRVVAGPARRVQGDDTVTCIERRVTESCGRTQAREPQRGGDGHKPDGPLTHTDGRGVRPAAAARDHAHPGPVGVAHDAAARIHRDARLVERGPRELRLGHNGVVGVNHHRRQLSGVAQARQRHRVRRHGHCLVGELHCDGVGVGGGAIAGRRGESDLGPTFPAGLENPVAVELRPGRCDHGVGAGPVELGVRDRMPERILGDRGDGVESTDRLDRGGRRLNGHAPRVLADGDCRGVGQAARVGDYLRRPIRDRGDAARRVNRRDCWNRRTPSERGPGDAVAVRVQSGDRQGERIRQVAETDRSLAEPEGRHRLPDENRRLRVGRVEPRLDGRRPTALPRAEAPEVRLAR